MAASTKEAALRWQHPLLHMWLHRRLMYRCFMTPIFHPHCWQLGLALFAATWV